MVEEDTSSFIIQLYMMEASIIVEKDTSSSTIMYLEYLE